MEVGAVDAAAAVGAGVGVGVAHFVADVAVAVSIVVDAKVEWCAVDFDVAAKIHKI